MHVEAYEMDDHSFREILGFFDLSWGGYRRVRKAVKKRLARHMQELRCRSVADYLDFLTGHPEAMRQARALLAVSISRFFRDVRLWQVLEQRVLPDLLKWASLQERPLIRAWSAGCASGEECYSLRILWEHIISRFADAPGLELWASDVNAQVLERARAGLYPESSLGNLSPVTLDESFRPHARGFAVVERIQTGIHWVVHDFILEDPPAMPQDLIFLRNSLLTYFSPAMQERVLPKILHALRDGGILVVGNNETLPAGVQDQLKPTLYRCIHRKQVSRSDGSNVEAASNQYIIKNRVDFDDGFQ